MIDGFNGYELNELGQVRSMKMMWKNPGHLLKLDKSGHYTLTNNENKRVRITPEQLLQIVFHSGKPLKPRPENAIYMGGRNKRFWFDEGINPKPGSDVFRMDFSKYIKDEK
jgi:hypothetical protein